MAVVLRGLWQGVYTGGFRMTNRDLSFMNKLCNPDYRPVSAIINAPFRLRDGEGKIISIATEGHALIGIYQDSDYPELTDTERLKVIKVITPTKLYNQHKIGFG